MPRTIFPPGTGSGTPSADGSGIGYDVLHQSATLVQNGTNAVSAIFVLPTGLPGLPVRIIDIISDNEVLWNSATSAILTVGIAAAGTQYASGVDARAGTRIRPTFTAAQLTAMRLVSPANSNVVATITPVGATSAGTTTVTILYDVG